MLGRRLIMTATAATAASLLLWLPASAFGGRHSAAVLSQECQVGHTSTGHPLGGAPGQRDDGMRPGWGYGDADHSHSGPPGRCVPPSDGDSATLEHRGRPGPNGKGAGQAAQAAHGNAGQRQSNLQQQVERAQRELEREVSQVQQELQRDLQKGDEEGEELVAEVDELQAEMEEDLAELRTKLTEKGAGADVLAQVDALDAQARTALDELRAWLTEQLSQPQLSQTTAEGQTADDQDDDDDDAGKLAAHGGKGRGHGKGR